MKAADFRQAAWAEVQSHLGEDLLRVHSAWLRHGPGTTEAVAQAAGISLLTFRPRSTDLGKLGLIALVPGQGVTAHGGIYEFRTPAQAEAAGTWRERGDFRRKGPPPTGPERVGFVTVEEAVASLAPADQAALGARLMGQWGHLRKLRESRAGAEQLTLLST